MSRFGRIRRRPDHWATPHERARARASERLDGPLGLTEAAWLDEHLAGCPDCAAVAQAYEDDRLALRGLREQLPEPPRDLWARTSAAIERESGARGRSRSRSGSRVPLGALSGLAVIAVVVGVSAVSSGILVMGDQRGPGVSGEDPAANAAGSASAESVAQGTGAAATPFAVGAGDVAYVAGRGADLALSNIGVDEVCYADDTADCGTLADNGASRLAIAAAPKAIIGSPTDGSKAVVVGDDGAGGDQLFVVALPEDAPASPAPAVTPSEPPASASVDTSATEAPTGTPTATPDASAPASGAPAESAAPDATPSDAASSPPDITGEPTPSATPPTPTPSPTTLVASNSPTPEPTIAASLAIASGLEVVGETAAFSEDGRWFAFAARPVDRSSGPDIWVWRVGDASAHQLTNDGISVFASWDGDTVVGSRPTSDDIIDGTYEPTSFTVDPVSGVTRTAIGWDVYRPVLDPKGRRAVVWAGSITASDAGTELAPGTGRLELRTWNGSDRQTQGSGQGQSEGQPIGSGAVADFDVRWDESGSWFGVWVAEPTNPAMGRLSLYHVGADGSLDVPDGSPSDVPALPGFSIGEGRMAWATPPGQGGEGSRVQIVAWTDEAVGSVETTPGEDVVVVR